MSIMRPDDQLVSNPCLLLQASWYGQFSPNGTKVEAGCTECSWDVPCLFDVVKDPTEHDDIAAGNPDIVSKLKQVHWLLLFAHAHALTVV